MTLAENAIMEQHTALKEPLIRRVMLRVIDRLDAQPAAERTHSIRINLDPEVAPEIYRAESLAARAVAWASVDGIVAAGWAAIDYRKHRRLGSREEREPYLDFRWPDAVEDLLREHLDRPRKAASYTTKWRALVASADLALPEDLLVKLSASPIEITGRPIEDVFSRFMSIRQLAEQPLLLREVSSRVFWGLSKVLDNRADTVAALLGCDECPFPEQPIVLNIHVTALPTSFLFVENHVAFERLKNSTSLAAVALIFSGGFRGAATRLRKVNGCSIYYSRLSNPSAMAVFEEMLFSRVDFPVYFWGDLDFSGMAILASLRRTFPSAEAWQAGYGPMLASLRDGNGHSPAESGKERQRIVERTGSAYADEHLIPALIDFGRFLDQE